MKIFPSQFFNLLAALALCSGLSACGGRSVANDSAPATVSMSAPPAPALSVVSVDGARSRYQITQSGDGVRVWDVQGVEPVRVFSAPAKIVFSDQSVNLQVVVLARQISEAQLQSLIELYIAFFNRIPDADGVEYWINELKRGVSLAQIADHFYNAGRLYPELTGYSATMSDVDFVRMVYKNVLGRSGSTAPDATELNYWANEIQSGRFSRATLINAMLVSARSFANDVRYAWVTALLNHKLSVARRLAVEQGISYLTADENIQRGMAIVAAISATDVSAAYAVAAMPDTQLNLFSVDPTQVAVMLANAQDGAVSLRFKLPESVSANSTVIANCSDGSKMVSSSVSATQNTIQVAGLQNGSRYFCGVSVQTSAGLQATSSAIALVPQRVEAGQFNGNVVLGAPTQNSVKANIYSPDQSGTVSISYGLQSGVYPQKTASASLIAGQPLEMNIDQLQADARYYYRVNFQSSSGVGSGPVAEANFHTARSAGSEFIFTIQGDSHPERPNEFNASLYSRSLATAAADLTDFHICLGDDFSVDSLNPGTVTQSQVVERYRIQRPYLGTIGRGAPVFLVNGNHEQSAGYLLNGSADNVAVWAQNARNAYYSQPAPDGFYTGNAVSIPFIGLPRNYYAWTWGDALFVVIDPYLPSPVPLATIFGNTPINKDSWAVTHGDVQYQWLKTTLETSKAKYRFVFAHHVMGAGRGGVEVAHLAEWGGQSKTGVNEFAAKRPSWSSPIHQLMAANKVNVFFQGHDHIWVRQQLDGVTYQTLSEPANPTYGFSEWDSAYLSGDKFPNTGYTRVTVKPAGVKVDYVRSYLPADESATRVHGATAFSYTLQAR
ncbi:MAG: DUF4214 domain-containing protein [Burkholderiales bacterium]|nr:DUF4214 domain-containing protein [Burkholderiales bacterium]